MAMDVGHLRRRTLAAKLRACKMRQPLAAHHVLYENSISAQEAAASQLRSLNAAWAESLARSPWARELRRAYSLPERFDSWTTFNAAVPRITKQELRAVVEAGSERYNATGGPKVIWRATGGSTAEPFRFPCFYDEARRASLDIWLGRRWHGIDAADRLFLLWGHAHLLGSGFRGRLNQLKRDASDLLLGYTRYSAYALADEDLVRACNILLKSRPTYVVGYSAALDRFSRVNARRSNEIKALSLRAVIATAEGFPRVDSRAVIEACFGAPVAMEYGSVETGALAYEDVGGKYFRIFWARNRVETRRAVDIDSSELIVTSLEPRALPLLRYPLGDLADVSVSEADAPCLRRLEGIMGRSNNTVRLPTGIHIHSEAFSHCMRDLAEVRAFQVVASKQIAPWIRYVATDRLSEGQVTELRRRLAKIDSSLDNTRFERVDAIAPSIAGKHPLVVER